MDLQLLTQVHMKISENQRSTKQIFKSSKSRIKLKEMKRLYNEKVHRKDRHKEAWYGDIVCVCLWVCVCVCVVGKWKKLSLEQEHRDKASHSAPSIKEDGEVI